MSFNINNYRLKIGNLEAICVNITRFRSKPLKIKGLCYVSKSHFARRLPLVDSIGLRWLFMVKIGHSLKRFAGVAETACLNFGNKRFKTPAIGENSASDAD